MKLFKVKEKLEKKQIKKRGIKKEYKTDFLPSVDYVFNVEDHLLVIGKKKDVDMILKCMS